ncbi:MAG: head-tail connector protein [Hyphomicrobiales bacterium]
MALLLTTPPAVEPLSLAEAKAHLRLDGDDEDALVTSLIATARTHVERTLDLALLTQGWSLLLDRWPDAGPVGIPLAPVQSVTSVEVADAGGGKETFAAEHYFLDAASTPARLTPTGSQPWPRPGRRAAGIEIAFTAGFGDEADDVPPPIRQALLLLAAHWFETREPVSLAGAVEVPATVAALLAPYRRVCL